MGILTSAQTLNELKYNYKKLANRYHPDRGGDNNIMQKINIQYNHMLEKIKLESTTNNIIYDNFTQVKVGMTVYVNGTKCEVLATSALAFRVVAVGRTRQAQFCKETGIGRFNSRLVATYHKPN